MQEKGAQIFPALSLRKQHQRAITRIEAESTGFTLNKTNKAHTISAAIFLLLLRNLDHMRPKKKKQTPKAGIAFPAIKARIPLIPNPSGLAK